MSKTSLRKFIKDFSDQQLQSLIMDVYSHSKDAKEYLDFLAEPDVAKKTEEYRKILQKEATRYTKRAFRPRMSRLRATLKRFRSLEPGDDAVAELMVDTLLALIGNGTQTWLPDALYVHIDKYMAEVLAYLKERDMMQDYVPRIIKMRRYISDCRHTINPLRRIVDDNLVKAGADLSQYDLGR